ncbi:MAG: hypothetical protein K6T75_01020, partial [Acetobacteraceae bacterium]|nr:hypothetical protein [Acetobacteraceae bacterium]
MIMEHYAATTGVHLEPHPSHPPLARDLASWLALACVPGGRLPHLAGGRILGPLEREGVEPTGLEEALALLLRSGARSAPVPDGYPGPAEFPALFYAARREGLTPDPAAVADWLEWRAGRAVPGARSGRAAAEAEGRGIRRAGAGVGATGPAADGGRTG